MKDVWLVQTTEVWRAPDQETADAMEQVFRETESFTLTKWTKQDVNVKSGGEIVETYVKITATKVFNNIKEPENVIRPLYQ